MISTQPIMLGPPGETRQNPRSKTKLVIHIFVNPIFFDCEKRSSLRNSFVVVVDLLPSSYLQDYPVYETILCTGLSCVQDYLVYRTILCMGLSGVRDYPVYRIIRCTGLSCLQDYLVYETIWYSELQGVWDYLVFGTICCPCFLSIFSPLVDLKYELKFF